MVRRSGLDPSLVSGLENERYGQPNALYLRRIAEAIGIPPAELLLAVGYLKASDAEDIQRLVRPRKRAARKEASNDN